MIESRHLAPIPRTTVADEIAKRLLALILDEGLRPGDKLPSERELIARLAVGRSSLREAIKMLSTLGLVRITPGGGTFVSAGDIAALARPLSWSLLMRSESTREVIEARQTVEVAMAGLAAERATAADIADIGERLVAMRASIHDAELFTHRDIEFHLAVARAARNQVLFQVLEALRHLLHAWIARVQLSYDDKLRGYVGHEPIEAAIRARDSEAARRAMAAHLDRAGVRLLALVGEQQAQESMTRKPLEHKDL